MKKNNQKKEVYEILCDLNNEDLSIRQKELTNARNNYLTAKQGGVQEEIEFLETEYEIAEDLFKTTLARMIEADLIETEAKVREAERASFEVGTEIYRSAAKSLENVTNHLNTIISDDSGKGLGPETSQNLASIGGVLTGIADNTRAAADITHANAEKEKAMINRVPPCNDPKCKIPYDQHSVVPGQEPHRKNPGRPGGGSSGGIGNLNINLLEGGDVDVRAAAQSRAGIVQGIGIVNIAAALAAARAMIRQMLGQQPGVILGTPMGVVIVGFDDELAEGTDVIINWRTQGGVAPRTVNIELFAPQSSADHLPGFHPIVEGVRDRGNYKWKVKLPFGHFDSKETICQTHLSGFYIRVSVVDVRGTIATDATNTFTIVRKKK